MTRHVSTEKDEATLEAHSASAAATQQEQRAETLHVRTRIRAGAATAQTTPPLVVAPSCAPMRVNE